MTSNDDRRLIASGGDPDRPYSHLEPVVAAELSWGNRVLSNWGRTDPLLDDRTLSLMRPFHIDQLRQTFRFPPTVRLYAMLPRPGYREKGRLLLSDTERYVTIYSPLPKEWTEAGEVEL